MPGTGNGKGQKWIYLRCKKSFFWRGQFEGSGVGRVKVTGKDLSEYALDSKQRGNTESSSFDGVKSMSCISSVIHRCHHE